MENMTRVRSFNITKLLMASIHAETELYNREIYRIHTQLHHISRIPEDNLIDEAESLIDVCCDLVEERVPQTWVMLSERSYVHTTHRLTSYLEYLSKRERQLSAWQEKIQKLSKRLLEKNYVIPLHSLWLGGLRNPKAIFYGMRSTHSTLVNTNWKKVNIVATFHEHSRHLSDIVVIDTYVIGAYLDGENGTLIRETINPIARIHLRAICTDDMDRKCPYYHCPIYSDLPRSQLVDYILFPCVNTEPLILSGVFMVLDIGTDIKQTRKEIIPLLIPPSIIMNESSIPIPSLSRKLYEEKFTLLHTLQEEDESPEIMGDTLDTGASSGVSNVSKVSYQLSDDQRSQTSLRKYSPLPPDMELAREKQNLMDHSGQKIESLRESETSTRSGHLDFEDNQISDEHIDNGVEISKFSDQTQEKENEKTTKLMDENEADFEEDNNKIGNENDIGIRDNRRFDQMNNSIVENDKNIDIHKFFNESEEEKGDTSKLEDKKYEVYDKEDANNKIGNEDNIAIEEDDTISDQMTTSFGENNENTEVRERGEPIKSEDEKELLINEKYDQVHQKEVENGSDGKKETMNNEKLEIDEKEIIIKKEKENDCVYEENKNREDMALHEEKYEGVNEEEKENGNPVEVSEGHRILETNEEEDPLMKPDQFGENPF